MIPIEQLFPELEIKLTNRETNEERTVRSNDEGEYSISSLRPGPYQVETMAQGFAKSVRNLCSP